MLRDLLRSSVEMQNMYDVSLQGLRQIGELQYKAQETRRSILYALTTNDLNQQIGYANLSREADSYVTEGIARYLRQAHDPQEVELGERLTKDWTAYLAIRNEVLGSILAGSLKEAVTLDLSVGMPAFDRVHQELEQIKRLYDEHASRQVAFVAGSYRGSSVLLIGGMGFVLLFGSLAAWVIERNQLRSTLELARLQMDFVASVSHELRTPITAILSAAENIRDSMSAKPEILHEQGSIIAAQATQLMELVDQVLQFATTTQRKPWHGFRPIKVSELVDHVLQTSSPLLQQAGVEVERKMQLELPTVVGDFSALSQCLQNLIVNAVKYGGSCGWVGICARSQKVENETPEVLISVQDHGRGIPLAELPHIFEPFYRSPGVVATQVRGTGLGLAIAKRSAELCGGRLTVTSEVGVGSTFIIHLPSVVPGSPLATVPPENP